MRQCQNCKKDFTIEIDDFNFYGEFFDGIHPSSQPGGLFKDFKNLSAEERKVSFEKFKEDLEKH